MGNFFEDMKRKAQEYAAHAKEEIAELDRKNAELQAEINAKRMKASGLLKRAESFPVKVGDDPVCMICWVDDGITSVMKPSDDPGDDIYRCRICGYQESLPD